jgi:LysM repeat protein
VNSAQTHHRPRKIRRTGRHTAPSQVQKVGAKAAPVCGALGTVAVAGVLVAAPQAHAAVAAPARPAGSVAVAAVAAVAAQARTDALIRHDQPASRHYTVRPGDTLSSIAERFYHNPADWRVLQQANSAEVKNPDLIFAGEVLSVPSDPPATMAYTPKHATRTTMLTSSTMLSGTLGCAALEELWEQAGGSSGQAITAASIAMAESSGQQFATGAAGERGYWQINPDHGSLSTYDPLGNAKAAVAISDDGTNWTPWTTFTSGIYRGRC